MRTPGDVLSYLEMCQDEGVNLQQGMNLRLRGATSVILSVRPGAPYADQVEDGGRVLVYEGHDVPRVRGGPDPKTLDQELVTSSGSPTQNGRFYEAAERARNAGARRARACVREGPYRHLGIQRNFSPRRCLGRADRRAASVQVPA